jgi:hypothetical protein
LLDEEGVAVVDLLEEDKLPVNVFGSPMGAAVACT